MRTLLGEPALRLLARRKLRGTLRKLLRRFRTFRGAVLTLLGVGVFALWLTSVAFHAFRGRSEGPPMDPEQLRALVALGALLWASAQLPEGFRLFQLPGDLRIERGNTTVFVPLTSMIVLSLLVSGLLWVFSRFR